LTTSCGVSQVLSKPRKIFSKHTKIPEPFYQKAVEDAHVTIMNRIVLSISYLILLICCANLELVVGSFHDDATHGLSMSIEMETLDSQETRESSLDEDLTLFRFVKAIVLPASHVGIDKPFQYNPPIRAILDTPPE